MLRVAMWLPVFAALFGPVSDRAAGVHTIYYTFLRVRPKCRPVSLLHHSVFCRQLHRPCVKCFIVMLACTLSTAPSCGCTHCNF